MTEYFAACQDHLLMLKPSRVQPNSSSPFTGDYKLFFVMCGLFNFFLKWH